MTVIDQAPVSCPDCGQAVEYCWPAVHAVISVIPATNSNHLSAYARPTRSTTQNRTRTPPEMFTGIVQASAP